MSITKKYVKANNIWNLENIAKSRNVINLLKSKHNHLQDSIT